MVNWWWGWIDRRWPVQGTPFTDELRLGLGFATTTACGIGLYLGRHNPLGRVALATTLFTVAAMTFVRASRSSTSPPPPFALLSGASAASPIGPKAAGRRSSWRRPSFWPARHSTMSSDLSTFATIALCIVRIWYHVGGPHDDGPGGGLGGACPSCAAPGGRGA